MFNSKTVFSVVLLALILLILIAVIFSPYMFTAEGEAKKGLAGKADELLYSQSLGESSHVFIYLQEDCFETVLVQKSGLVWKAVPSRSVSTPTERFGFLSYIYWTEADIDHTFIAMQNKDDRVSYAEIGTYKVPIENEISVLTVQEKINLQNLRGEVFAENGDLLYTLVSRPTHAVEYMVPIWDAENNNKDK